MPIFISYRREDSAGYAGRLHEELAGRFGAGQVFRDVDTLRPGQDFDDAIRRRLERCNACVVMIGPAWLKAQTAAGQPRLGSPGDYVTKEIAAALSKPHVAIVPVLVGGATMPSQEDLPEVLRPVARRHAFTARDETWDADMDRLAVVLKPSMPGEATSAFRSFGPVSRYAVPTLVLIFIAAAGAWFASRNTGNTSNAGRTSAELGQSAGGAEPEGDVNRTTPDAPADAPSYAIDVPVSAGEVAHGDLIYAVVAGSVQRRGMGMRVWLRMRASNEGFYNASFWDDSFRLVAGGQTIPATGGLNEILERRSIRQGVIRFDLPTVQRTAILRISHQNRSADLPLDLSGTGAPPRHDAPDPRDALSHALFTPVVGDEFSMLETDDVTAVAMRVSRRAFVNAQRITVVVRWSNTGRYAIATGDLIQRLAAGGEVLAPFKSPLEVVEPGSTYVGDVVFDVPPQVTTATLRATLRDSQQEWELRLRR
jgi:hypothetical protein